MRVLERPGLGMNSGTSLMGGWLHLTAGESLGRVLGMLADAGEYL